MVTACEHLTGNWLRLVAVEPTRILPALPQGTGLREHQSPYQRTKATIVANEIVNDYVSRKCIPIRSRRTTAPNRRN